MKRIPSVDAQQGINPERVMRLSRGIDADWRTRRSTLRIFAALAASSALPAIWG
jgi:hypothetical protein